MIDVCFPKNNEEEFVNIAKRLGTDTLIFVYDDPKKFYNKKSSINILNALITTAKNVVKARNKSDLVLLKSDGINDRLAFEQTKPDIIFNLEEVQRKDFIHQRASGLNHIHAKLANKNQIIIGFSFNSLLKNTGIERARIIGRMIQNIEICRKYKVNVGIASFATQPYELRNLHDMEAFFITLGMNTTVNNCANVLLDKIKINQKKKKGEYHESIEVVD